MNKGIIKCPFNTFYKPEAISCFNFNISTEFLPLTNLRWYLGVFHASAITATSYKFILSLVCLVILNIMSLI